MKAQHLKTKYKLYTFLLYKMLILYNHYRLNFVSTENDSFKFNI